MDLRALEKAVALRDSGRVQEAIRKFDELARSTEDLKEKASLLVNQARCYRLLKQFAEARRQLSFARRVAPETQLLAYVEFEEAVLHWHEGERSEALDVLDNLVSDERQLLMQTEHRELYEQVQSSRGMMLTELSRYGEATPLLEESRAFDSRVVEKEAVLRDLGLCYLESGDHRRAKAIFEECLRERSQGASATMAHYYLGTIFFEESAFAKAQLEFEACLPGTEEARIPTGHIYAYLARTARHLGMKREAERYQKLAKG